MAEVLLTLVIMSVILLTITRILLDARTTRDWIHNVQEQELAGPAILEQIEADLRAMTVYARDPRTVLRVQNHVVSGLEADSLDFVTTTDGVLPHRETAGALFTRADVNEVGYRLRPNPTADDFLELYRREDFGVDDEPFDGGEFALLHDRVTGFEIRLFREDGVEAEPEEAWGGGADDFVGVPARIEIELTVELAPRLVREQLVQLSKMVTYKRVIRFPAALAKAQEVAAIPVVPRISKPVPKTQAAGPPPGGGPTDEKDDGSSGMLEDDRGGGGGGGTDGSGLGGG
jgi:hypothetical protein